MFLPPISVWVAWFSDNCWFSRSDFMESNQNEGLKRKWRLTFAYRLFVGLAFFNYCKARKLRKQRYWNTGNSRNENIRLVTSMPMRRSAWPLTGFALFPTNWNLSILNFQRFVRHKFITDECFTVKILPIHIYTNNTVIIISLIVVNTPVSITARSVNGNFIFPVRQTATSSLLLNGA